MNILVVIVILILIGFLWGIFSKMLLPLLLLGGIYLLIHLFKAKKVKEFRGFPYIIHPNRDSFHDEFLLKDSNLSEEVHTCELDSKGRVVGAFILFRGSTLTKNKKEIREGIIKRDDKARKSAFVPGMDSVKNKLTKVDGKDYFHYHRTHLIPFRFCLNDGEYSNMMFTGTSRLNAGYTPELGIIPTYENHVENVDYIIECINKNPYYFDDISSGAESAYTLGLSLDDFERTADKLVYDSYETYRHLYKYGVECIYKSEGLIPSHVRVLFIDTTTKKLVFSATLKNTL